MDKKIKKEQMVSDSVSDKNIDSDADKIMEETLKEIFDEVNSSDEDKNDVSDKAGKKMDKKAEEDEGNPKGQKVSDNKENPERIKNPKNKTVVQDEEEENCTAEKITPNPEILQQTENDLQAKKKKRNKIIGWTAGIATAVLAVVYFGGAYYFSSHFYLNTTVNGTDFSRETADEVEKYMKGQVEDYALSIKKIDNSVETIDGDDIDLEYKKSDEIHKLIKKQNGFLWPKGIWTNSKIRADVGVDYNDSKLQEKINALDCVKEENQVAPVSAHPEFDGNSFVVKEEDYGSQINREMLDKKIVHSIQKFENELELQKEKCYVMPSYLKDDEVVTQACETMNKYLPASITYALGDGSEVVDKTLISQWLTTDENMQVTFHADQISEFVKGLASKYNTRGTQRSFVSGNGNTVSVKGGSYGWVLDQNAEVEYLENAIANGTVEKREPVFRQKAASHGAVDWGNTFVEIDLTNQQLYLFVNGSVILNAPVVTGKPSAGNATPQGVYSISYCQRNAVLRGPKMPNGKYKWESPVSFWMPFNGGIGLHDANWQSSFGGNRYLTHGSHGCVNLQYSVAEKVFANVHAGTPVVCHY